MRLGIDNIHIHQAGAQPKELQVIADDCVVRVHTKLGQTIISGAAALRVSTSVTSCSKRNGSGMGRENKALDCNIAWQQHKV